MADIDVIRRFDAKTGVPKGEILVQGATFLNDVAAAPDGTIYVSDMGMKIGPRGLEPSGSDAIYKISPDGTLSTLAKGPELGRPNGLVVDGDLVRVVTFGTGELYAVGEDGKRTAGVKLPLGRLDGVVRLARGQLLISSREAHAIYRGEPQGPFVVVQDGISSPADIGWDPKRSLILAPRLYESTLSLFELDTR